MTKSRSRTLLVVCTLLIGSTVVAVATVAAAQPDVQISSVTVTPNETETGESVTVETTIANLESSNGTVEITDIYLRTQGSTEGHGRIENVGSISPGGSVSIPMETTFESAGQKRLTAHVVVRDESGDHHSYEYPVYVDVADPTVKAGLSSTTANNQSGMTEVTLTNFGNTDLTDVEIEATTNGETLDQSYVFDVAPGASQSTLFDTDSVSADSVTFTATYTAAGDTHTTSRTVAVDDDEQVEGEIRLTGIDTTRTGQDITIEGDAANIGSTDTESVLVRIPNSTSVSPVSPSGEYFIGPVDASEFATFDLTGEIESATSSVPVEITYIVDGERVTTTQQLDIESANSSAPRDRVNGGDGGQGPATGPGSSESGLPLLPIGVALALIVVGIGAYRWRSQ